jgi:hypothetical protein
VIERKGASVILSSLLPPRLTSTRSLDATVKYVVPKQTIEVTAEEKKERLKQSLQSSGKAIILIFILKSDTMKCF